MAVLTLVMVPLAADATPPARGYQSRACGFDLDDDGILGEPGDCDICDAALVGGLVSGGTADPDNDGVAEDLIYVDCDGGSNQSDCGTPGKPPCATLTYALTNRVDGAADGAEDIVCFRGTCAEPADLTPATSGVPGHRVKPASGSEEWDFQFPTNPAMLVGWDTDGDGNYPPFDPDDTAVMHGDPDEIDNDNGTTRTFRLNDGIDNSYFEMAHFTVKDYGRDDTDPHDAGLVKLNSGRSSSHLYLHDLRLLNINRDQQPASARSTFNWFAISDYEYLAFINIEALDNGSYFNRGAGTDDGPFEAGPVRFQNFTYTGHSCDFDNSQGNQCQDINQAFVSVAKIWGWVANFEWLDSHWDANVNNWVPKASGGPSGAGGIGPAQCAQDWVVRNNEFIDFKVALSVQGWDESACLNPGRPVTDIVFDGNLVRNEYEPWSNGDHAVNIGGNGPTAERTTGDITITNNFFSSPAGWEATIDIKAGNESGPNPGTIVIANNTFDAWVSRSDYGVIFVRDEGVQFPHQDFVIKNNVITGLLPAQLAVKTGYPVSIWDVDSNIYDPTANFSWAGGAPISFSAWKASSGGDAGSDQCTPIFANPSAGDYHLQPSDTCALNQGEDITALIGNGDIDDDIRPQMGGFDAGADEMTADNTAPAVTILEPSDGTSAELWTLVDFSAMAADLEEGDLSNDLTWSSDLEGEFGSGSSFSALLSAGNHTVTASVIDSGFLLGSDSIQLGITCSLPADLLLEDMILTTDETHMACNSITVLDVRVQSAATLTLVAAEVSLGDGFSLGPGAGLRVSDSPLP